MRCTIWTRARTRPLKKCEYRLTIGIVFLLAPECFGSVVVGASTNHKDLCAMTPLLRLTLCTALVGALYGTAATAQDVSAPSTASNSLTPAAPMTAPDTAATNTTTTAASSGPRAGLDPERWGSSPNAPSYRWYVAPSVGGVVPDGDRRTRSSVLYGLGVGYWVTPRMTLDLGLNTTNADFKNSSGRGGRQWETTGVDVTGRWYTGTPDRATRAYLLAGLGELRDAAVSGRDSWGPSAEVGIGVQHAFTDRIALRGEIGARYDRNRASRYLPTLPSTNHYVDGVAQVALVIGLGHIPRAVEERPQPPEPQPTPPDCSQQFRNGVNLCVNKCPTLPEGTIVGPDGCPQKVVIDLRGVHFKFDRPKGAERDIAPTLMPPASDSLDELNQVVDLLQRSPNTTVEIDGYTDSIGTARYNMGLSDRRARIVSRYLLDHGIAADRISGVKGFGKDDPVAPNDTADGRAMNRRVEIKPEQDSPQPMVSPSSDQPMSEPKTSNQPPNSN